MTIQSEFSMTAALLVTLATISSLLKTESDHYYRLSADRVKNPGVGVINNLK